MYEDLLKPEYGNLADYKDSKKSFTKSIMSTVVRLFFAGAILGGILVVVSAANDIFAGRPIDTGMFIAYAAYLGTPTATAIAFYAWKSKAENLLKIKNSNEIMLERSKNCLDTELIQILANMNGGN